jgi:hypothetical protein
MLSGGKAPVVGGANDRSIAKQYGQRRKAGHFNL